VVSAALGWPVMLAGFHAVPVAYQPGSPATGALLLVAGEAADGEAWRLFLKVLQHPRHWPRIGEVPPAIRQLFLDRFPWRMELAAWEPGFADRLPAGMRLPRRYRLAELGDDRVAVWMEDVRVGFDLGQLLVGLTHAGELPAAALPAIHRTLVPPSPPACGRPAAEPPAGRSPSATWPAWSCGPGSPPCRSSASASRLPRPWPRPSASGPP
jgi:hypothetical protein